MGQILLPYLNLAPLGAPLPGGALVPSNGLRGSHCEVAAVEALSCGRDRVRWPVPLAALSQRPPAVEPAAILRMLAAGSLVLRRMAWPCHNEEVTIHFRQYIDTSERLW